MNKEQRQKYLKDNGRCPYCESGNIEGISSPQVDFSEAWWDILCCDCLKKWREYYKFYDVEALDEDDCAIQNEEQEPLSWSEEPLSWFEGKWAIVFDDNSQPLGKILLDDLLAACRCALADLEGIMPDFEPSGERTHPVWQTIKELRRVLGVAA